MPKIPKKRPEKKRNDLGQFLKGTHWRPRQPWWDRGWLYNQYIRRKKSAAAIAREGGVIENAILYWLKKHKIRCRSMSTIRRRKHWGSSGSSNPMWNRKGALNPNWKGGSSPKRQTDYENQRWKRVSRLVRNRDQYQCNRCGQTKTKEATLHLHHILGWTEFPKFRFVARNLVTLCKECHDWIHSNANAKKELTGRDAYITFEALLGNVG